MEEVRKLQIRFAGRLIDLLGQQMYGGPVQSVAELIANAWDADAKKVKIIIPETLNTNSEIIVRDYGKGMTFDELNNYYLHIGYERRKGRGERTDNGRLVMGRKGIGKLAGFGIAEDIVLKSVKNGNLVQFTLNYTDLRNLETIGNFEFLPEINEPSSELSGVTVTFKKLKLSRNISLESFRRSMARRFALGSDEMEIIVNGAVIKKESLDFDFRIPETNGDWETENIEGFGTVKYWFGFLKDTIKDPELRGISVFARERIAQFTPFVFNLTGGINGQVGLEYLTGQVKAEPLDDDMDSIATDRQTVNWQFSKAQILEQWGQQKVKDLCKVWKKKKDEKNINKFRHDYGEYYSRIEHLQGQEKEDLIYALDKIATLERIEESDFKVIANSMISGIERESVKKIIKRINSASDDAATELLTAIKEWDIISAVSTAEVVFGKLEIIKQFDNLIKERTPEKAPKGQIDMQTFVKGHPWILGPDYEQLGPADFDHERGIDKWIKDIILETDREPAFKGEKEDKRFDLACIKNDFLIVVLELMRPGKPADYDHASRLVRYVTRISAGINSKGSQERFKRMSVYGLLIADDLAKDPSLSGYFQTNRSYMDYMSWSGLFDIVSARYKDFFEMLKKKAPDDPRIKGLITINATL
jgi:hypothetical protein